MGLEKIRVTRDVHCRLTHADWRLTGATGTADCAARLNTAFEKAVRTGSRKSAEAAMTAVFALEAKHGALGHVTHHTLKMLLDEIFGEEACAELS